MRGIGIRSSVVLAGAVAAAFLVAPGAFQNPVTTIVPVAAGAKPAPTPTTSDLDRRIAALEDTVKKQNDDLRAAQAKIDALTTDESADRTAIGRQRSDFDGLAGKVATLDLRTSHTIACLLNHRHAFAALKVAPSVGAITFSPSNQPCKDPEMYDREVAP